MPILEVDISDDDWPRLKLLEVDRGESSTTLVGKAVHRFLHDVPIRWQGQSLFNIFNEINLSIGRETAVGAVAEVWRVRHANTNLIEMDKGLAQLALAGFITTDVAGKIRIMLPIPRQMLVSRI